MISLTEKLPNTYAAIHLKKQLIRSGTSPAFQHAEAQSAESVNDFIHKLKIALKELRETMVNLLILKKKPFLKDEILLETINECEELISIFVKSIQTARKNQKKSK